MQVQAIGILPSHSLVQHLRLLIREGKENATKSSIWKPLHTRIFTKWLANSLYQQAYCIFLENR